MFISYVTIRVRYAETDRMGLVYYGRYAEYFEVGRVETLRQLGMDYRQVEEEGFLLPVLEFSVKFFKPIFYDDLLTIETVIPSLPAVRFRFNYRILNSEKVTVSEAYTLHAFVRKSSFKPCGAPESILHLLQPFFK
jgi:acyl-CoA thioester hydrolase